MTNQTDVRSRVGFRFLVGKRGQTSYSVTDLVQRYEYPNRFHTQRAANAFTDGLIEAEAERKETAQILDGWCL